MCNCLISDCLVVQVLSAFVKWKKPNNNPAKNIALTSHQQCKSGKKHIQNPTLTSHQPRIKKSSKRRKKPGKSTIKAPF